MVTARRWSSGREGGLFPVGAGGVPCPSDHSSPPPSLPAPGDRGRGWQLSCQTAAPHYSSGTASKLPAGFLFTLSLGSKTSSTSAIDCCIHLITNCYLRLPQIFCFTMTALVVVSCRSCSLSHALSSVCCDFFRHSMDCYRNILGRPGADCGSNHELFIAKFRLKLKKAGKTTRPFRYDLN